TPTCPKPAPPGKRSNDWVSEPEICPRQPPREAAVRAPPKAPKNEPKNQPKTLQNRPAIAEARNAPPNAAMAALHGLRSPRPCHQPSAAPSPPPTPPKLPTISRPIVMTFQTSRFATPPSAS